MKYHDHANLLAELDSLQQAAPSDVSLFTLGKSMGGRELRGIRLNSKPNGTFIFVLDYWKDIVTYGHRRCQKSNSTTKY